LSRKRLHNISASCICIASHFILRKFDLAQVMPGPATVQWHCVCKHALR